MELIALLSLVASWDAYTDPTAADLRYVVTVDGTAQAEVVIPPTQTSQPFTVSDSAKEVTFDLRACNVLCSEPASVTVKKPAKAGNLKIGK